MNAQAHRLARTPSGIVGFDEITGGGLPTGRCSLVCGAAGAGKTLFGLTFLAEGALRFGEPGVFISFEETEAELAANVASLGYDLEQLRAANQLAVDYVRVERAEIAETGDYDLDGLFLRIGHAIRTVGARRVVLDTPESLFSSFSNAAILRAELRRLFGWLKAQGVTSVITAESGGGELTRHGLEEYVSDCVILLDQRVLDQVATRRLRVVKYRGASHGGDEYPFLIDETGVSVLALASPQLAHDVSTERVRTGAPALDDMLGGEGFWRGSSILLSGAAGTGKTTFAAQFAAAACARGEKAVYFAFEESPQQVARNMRAVGIGLQRWIDAGLLHFVASRPSSSGLETHLARMCREVERFAPDVAVVDPLFKLGGDVGGMLLRLIDYFKGRGVTALLTFAESTAETPDHAGVSSLMDAWLQARMTEAGGERQRGLLIRKARGIAHSHQIRRFELTAQGVRLLPAAPAPRLAAPSAASPARSVVNSVAVPGVAVQGSAVQGSAVQGSAVQVSAVPSSAVSGAAKDAGREPAADAAEVERRHAAEARKRMIEIRRRELGARIATLQSKLAQSEREADMLFARQQGAEEAAAQFRREAAEAGRHRGRT
ncbi:circadian clock protein KaiC [Rhodoblastus acidophilus]|uniref:circadian clock protein KaiC n=1 Tax=Rhodoblastus acidophilus TaxID=1074 RepID=UPI0022240C7A|nr:circadian clock protein KaiC [Rhodoblastus acidophilus]